MGWPFIAIVSGGFDPVTIGHVRMFKEAASLADRLFVIVNNDNWLIQKKGFVFMPQAERIEIIEAIKYVEFAMATFHDKDCEDMSVANELAFMALASPDWRFIFCNGGDRKEGCLPTAEEKVCQELGIEMRYNVGGEKIQSSSWLVEKAKGACRTVMEVK